VSGLRLLLVEGSPDDALLIARELVHTWPDLDWRRVESPAELEAALGEEWDAVVADSTVMAPFAITCATGSSGFRHRPSWLRGAPARSLRAKWRAPRWAGQGWGWWWLPGRAIHPRNAISLPR